MSLPMRRQALPWCARRRCDGGQVQPGPIPEIRSRFSQPETGHSLSLWRQRMVSWRSDPGSI